MFLHVSEWVLCVSAWEEILRESKVEEMKFASSSEKGEVSAHPPLLQK